MNVTFARVAQQAARLLLSAPLVLVAGCYGADFTQTGTNYAPRPRSPEQVRVTSEHPGPGFAEVGLLTGSDGSFEGAIKRIKEEAGERGCDVVFVQGEAIQSGYGTPGAAYGMTKSHVRAACFVAIPGAPPEQVASVAGVTSTAASVAVCAPDCRQGFDCVQGQCVSSCNPGCAAGQSCMGHGSAATCVAEGAQSAK